MSRLFWTAPRQLVIKEPGWFRFAVARLDGFEGAAWVASRIGYTDDLCYEVFCHPRDSQTVFDAIWEAV